MVDGGEPEGAAAPAGEGGADQPEPHGDAAAAPVPLKMAEEEQFIAVAGSPLLMASVPSELAPRLAAEKELVEERRKEATGADAELLDRQKLALAAITRQVVQIDAAILERGPEDAVVSHGLRLLRALTEGYGVDYKRPHSAASGARRAPVTRASTGAAVVGRDDPRAHRPVGLVRGDGGGQARRQGVRAGRRWDDDDRLGFDRRRR